MNIETVNELIASLESAGELSIREQKFLKLAKAYQQLAAENVQIKAMNDCLSEELRGYESDGAFEGPKMHLLWWQVETLATDAYLAGIKADAITATLDACSDYLDTDCVMDRLDISYEEAEKRTSGAIEFHDAMVDFANQVREGADK
ncbi:TPA: hypothetical protein NIV67_005082 [Klebsiella quasipneumoniae subsp. similipneumoniae]|uniref:hypothetical protein n=1 Tax=Klebsiella pneumoniae TaxID=573 RepID=UPI000E2AF56F|nr:hypothetical protein [Klebsiella pneumoniae]SWC84966.1 Uncharacterised protein [Klebsiella pneumoniae]HBQ5685539.1 hypothetical protein [Klebsiella pneumoniae subsp. pneumoniae]HBZ7976954.1 hypothetical protein [Klebsiella pneumoniae]HCF8479912.1 hypothetical protein [Klebsiella quasipneumoniae subsp. similipneumoniae]